MTRKREYRPPEEALFRFAVLRRLPIDKHVRRKIFSYVYWVERTWYSNGQLQTETPYVDGEKHGIHREWLYTGPLLNEVSYVDGKRHGNHRVWDTNGRLMWEIPYVDGREHGTHREWSKTGNKII